MLMTSFMSQNSSNAFACSSVLGNPSNIMPSQPCVAFLISSIIVSSGRSSPFFIISFIFSPSSVPFFVSSLSRSPALMCLYPYFSTSSLACVPFPLPAIPNSMMFFIFFHPMYLSISLCSMSFFQLSFDFFISGIIFSLCSGNSAQILFIVFACSSLFAVSSDSSDAL